MHGGNAGIVLNAHLVVVLVTLLQSAQDGDGRKFVGLIDHDRLEAALQGLVFLKVLLILIECGGTNGTQFATGQRRLQDVGGIHCTLAAACTHQRVDLIDEKNDAALAARDLIDHALQALLKLTLVLRTSHQRAHVEREELLVLQVLRHIAAHDTPCQSLDNGGLTRTGFADEDGVVLRAPRENLEHAANLIVTADDGVELALSGEIHEVLGILLQRLIVVVGTLALHLLSLTQFEDGLTHVLLGGTGILQHAAHGRVDHEQRQQDGFA